jgi:NAD(P)-dependent dehydrogenase (short-subunit alcohol dehydrogenase family)
VSADLFSLSGRVALVTGGNSGIGRTLALALAEAGAQVIIGARRRDRNAAVLAELGSGATSCELDVGDEASVERAMRTALDGYGRLDILINNAGTAQRASVMDLAREDWDRVLTVNLTGAFLCTKHAARLMKKQRAGKIINIASVYGLVAPSRGQLVSYTVSKHALIGLTRVNAVELAPLGIQVNAIAPGFFFTEMNSELRGTSFERAVVKRTPDGRWGDTRELIGTCVYLASAASDHVTGACLTVDGGYFASDGLERGG